MDANLEDFIKKNARISDLCKDYKEYSKEVQQCLKNVYVSCWRFDLRTNQILHILNQTLTPFEKKQKPKKEEKKELTIFDMLV